MCTEPLVPEIVQSEHRNEEVARHNRAGGILGTEAEHGLAVLPAMCHQERQRYIALPSCPGRHWLLSS